MNNIDLKKYNSLKLNQRVLFISSDFVVKEICENGDIILKSESKNLPDKLVRSRDVKYVYPSKSKTTKRYQLEMI